MRSVLCQWEEILKKGERAFQGEARWLGTDHLAQTHVTFRLGDELETDLRVSNAIWRSEAKTHLYDHLYSLSFPFISTKVMQIPTTAPHFFTSTLVPHFFLICLDYSRYISPISLFLYLHCSRWSNWKGVCAGVRELDLYMAVATTVVEIPTLHMFSWVLLVWPP